MRARSLFHTLYTQHVAQKVALKYIHWIIKLESIKLKDLTNIGRIKKNKQIKAILEERGKAGIWNELNNGRLEKLEICLKRLKVKSVAVQADL